MVGSDHCTSEVFDVLKSVKNDKVTLIMLGQFKAGLLALHANMVANINLPARTNYMFRGASLSCKSLRDEPDRWWCCLKPLRLCALTRSSCCCVDSLLWLVRFHGWRTSLSEISRSGRPLVTYRSGLCVLCLP